MRPKTIFKGDGLPPSVIHAKRSGTGKKLEKDSPTISRDHAIFIGNDVISMIRVTDQNVKVSFAGSIRREVEQVHDIDILVSPFSEKVKTIIETWVNADLLWSGNDKVSILMPTGELNGSKVQVDVRFIKPESWGPALQYFTGSREHNISLRSIAKRRNLILNEHGLFDQLGKRLDDGTEGGVYKALSLRWLPPKYRNGYIQRTPKPTWCIDHQVKDFCKRSRLLASKSEGRKDTGNTGEPDLANSVAADESNGLASPFSGSNLREDPARFDDGSQPPKGGASLKSPDVIMENGQDKTQDDLP